MAAKIAIFHWGTISVHSFYLAEQLSRAGVIVDLYLYTPAYANKHFYSKTLLRNLKNIHINVIEIKCTPFEDKLIKLNKIGELFGHPWPAIFINPLLSFKTRRLFKDAAYRYVITIAQSSLYWLFKTNKHTLKKTIHYSLEIEKITDPNIKKNSLLYAIINKESRLLKSVAGLIIQDRWRAEALLNCKDFRRDLHVFYIPVSIPGNIIQTRSDYLYERLAIEPHKKIILYFGAVYEERKVDELATTFAGITNPDWTLVIHGAGEFSHLAKGPNIKTSNLLLEYDDLHLIISSATIGIAFYDNSWPNTRLTAYSSEKIARYLQTGVPFVAFKNESYTSLKNEFNCCELIDKVSDLQQALAKILEDYEAYRMNCFKAYNKYYNIHYTTKALTEFLQKKNDEYVEEL